MKKRISSKLLLISSLVVLGIIAFIIITGATWKTPPGPGAEGNTARFETRGEYQLGEGEVVFSFSLVNHHAEAKTLPFGSGQQFEIVVKDEKNQEVYRYSDGKFFTLALVYRNIDPGAALHWEDRWDLRDQEGKKVSPGRYRAEIEIIVIPEDEGAVIDPQQLRTSVEFTLTEEVLATAEGQHPATANPEKGAGPTGFAETERIKGTAAEAIIGGIANEVIHALQAQDGVSLARFVHPGKGVRFTPYTYVQPETDRVFSPEQIRTFFQDQTVYHWGYYDGTGDEIKLTPGEYYHRFIYSADFVNAEQIGYNEVLSFGNMLENQFEVYDQPIIVEYYFSGFNPEYAGLDWQSLRLVFEEHDDGWKLTGIIHNEWTI
jgi:hypothetical protein